MSNSLTAEIQKILSPDTNGLTIYVALGNDLRGDDAIGPYIATHCPKLGPQQKLINAGEHPENIIDEVTQLAPTKVVFIDAADFGQAPGTIAPIPLEALPEHTLSTHRFPVAVIAQLIKEDTKANLFFIGIQLAQIHYNQPLSSEVINAGQELVDYINCAS